MHVVLSVVEEGRGARAVGVRRGPGVTEVVACAGMCPDDVDQLVAPLLSEAEWRAYVAATG